MVLGRYRRDLLDELRRMDEWMEEWMERQFHGTIPYYAGVARRVLPRTVEEMLAGAAAPSIDISEKEGKIVVAADMPGVEKEDITISIKGNVLEIGAEKKEETGEMEEGYIRRERGYMKFYRSVPLPAEVDAERVDATFKNGVLRIEMLKIGVEEVKKIEVK